MNRPLQQTRYIRSNHHETVHLDNEWIIFNTDDYTVTRLNDTGGFCWSLLDGAQTVHSLARALRDEYELDHEWSGQELESFLDDLVQYGMVQHADE